MLISLSEFMDDFKLLGKTLFSGKYKQLLLFWPVHSGSEFEYQVVIMTHMGCPTNPAFVSETPGNRTFVTQMTKASPKVHRKIRTRPLVCVGNP